MSLDLFIREKTNYGTNSKGNLTYVVEELDNLENCHNILEAIQAYGSLSNCSSISLLGGTFVQIRDDMTEQLEKEYKPRKLSFIPSSWNTEDIERYCSQQETAYENELDKLNCFVESEHLTLDSEREFEVTAWW